MPWRVEVTPAARQSIAQLDSGLRQELIEHVDELADEPAAFLTRAEPSGRAELWALEHGSSVLSGLRVRLLFADLDFRRQTMKLVGVGRLMGGDEADSS